MAPVLNRPCMEHIVRLLHGHGIFDAAVTLQYLPEEIKSYFGDGRGYGVHLSYFTETEPLGTAGSVKNTAAFLDETFVVISGDALTDCSLAEAFQFHRQKKALATLVLTTVTCPLEYGVVITDGEGRIMRFLEKPGWGEVFSDTVNTGIYILEPEILEYIDENEMVDFSKDLFPRLLAAGQPLYAFVADGYWCDIGNIEQYMQAQFDMLEKEMDIGAGIRVGKNARIHPSAELIPPLVIGDHCLVGPHAGIGPLAVLGNGVRIGQGSSLKRCILWDNVLVGERAELRGAVLGRGARLLDGARAFEGSVIGEQSVVGEGSLIKPGVKIWPAKWVEKGTLLSKSIVWGSCGRARLFGNRGITGSLFTEITPDFACCLGLALGSSAAVEGKFFVGSDGYPDTAVIKNALITGLMSSGLQVIDLDKVTLPAHRYGIPTFNAIGGAHIYRMGGAKINIRLMNGRGADYTRAEQRKVEGLLSREEYRYALREGVLQVKYQPALSRSYLNYLLQLVDQELIRRARLKIVVGYDPVQLGDLLPALLEALACQVITVPVSGGGVQDFPELLQAAEHLDAVVREQGADFGAVLDCGSEKAAIVDEQGRALSEELLAALLSLITMQSNQNPVLALPVTVPESVAEMVRNLGGEVRRTKTAPWAVMQAFLEEDVYLSQQRWPQFLLYCDALAVLASLAEFLARQAKSLSKVLAELPGFITARRDVQVDWDDKGKVLRHLAKESAKGKIETVETAEGIKVRHPQGWAAVLPDAEEPVCRVYSEAFNQEAAESLTEMYVQKIQDILE